MLKYVLFFRVNVTRNHADFENSEVSFTALPEVFEALLCRLQALDGMNENFWSDYFRSAYGLH